MVKRIAIAAALVAVVALILWASLRPSEGKGPAVTVEKVARRDVVARVKASGAPTDQAYSQGEEPVKEP